MTAGPPTLMDQQPHVLYTMPPQTVERLEDVLRKTLALQETIRASMDTLATRENLEPLATGQQLVDWLEQADKTHQGICQELHWTLLDNERTTETGWKLARRIYEAALRAGQGVPRGWLRADENLPEMGGPHHPEFRGGGPGDQHSDLQASDVTEDVLRLLARLEGNTGEEVIDATVRRQHRDRKALAREQRKKIALGHKAADHEQGQQMG